MRGRELMHQSCRVSIVLGTFREMRKDLCGWREVIKIVAGDQVTGIGESCAKELVFHKPV